MKLLLSLLEEQPTRMFFDLLVRSGWVSTTKTAALDRYFFYQTLRQMGKKKMDAYSETAEKFRVSTTAIRNTIKEIESLQ